MNRLLIVGAGGFGRELFSYCLDHPDNGVKWEIGGFLDDNANALTEKEYPVSVISNLMNYVPSPKDILICGIGTPFVKRKICEDLISRGSKFSSFIHHTVICGHNVKFGQGVVLCPGVKFTCDTTVGDFTTFNCASGAGHDCVIGDYSTVSGSCEITGGVSIGTEVMVGSHATVLPRVNIGDRAVIGAGSVVIKNVNAYETVFGNPARVILAKSS